MVLDPALTVLLGGLAETRKSAATTRVALALCTRLPLVPVIVNGYVPAATPVPGTVTVRMLPLALDVTPEGKPLAESVTVPVKPFSALTFTVYVPLYPAPSSA